MAYLTPELVSYLGQGNDILGWQLTMAVYGCAAAILFTTAFFTTKERIQPQQNQQTSVIQDIKDLTSNKPWIVLFLLALIIMMTITLRGSSGTFYFKYFVQREDLIGNFSLAYMLSLAVGRHQHLY